MKKDILFLCQFFYPEHNSSATLLFDTAKYLAANGFTVDALCGYPKEAVRQYCVKAGRERAKYTLYQVDPLAGNYAYRSCSNDKLQEYEKNLYSMMDSVFTTPVIWKEKQKANWNMHGVTAVEFPGILKGAGGIGIVQWAYSGNGAR